MKPSKKKRVLLALTQRGYHQFEAERELSDHCLHSTVSTIQNQRNIPVARSWETVRGFQGMPTRCCRYWIAPEHVDDAIKTANRWR